VARTLTLYDYVRLPAVELVAHRLVQTVMPPPPRYRVTRRGNVYDGIARRTVFASWGMASVRDRHGLAQAWIRRQALGEALMIETALEYPEAFR